MRARPWDTNGAIQPPTVTLERRAQATMQKILSTYLFVSRKLTYELLAQISEHGFSGLEVFCSRAHFDYGSKQKIHALTSPLEPNRITLSPLHAPTSNHITH